MTTLEKAASELALIASQWEGPKIPDFGAFLLDGVPVPTIGMNFVDLSRFETKITYGDYVKDSDNLLSTLVRSTWAEGALIDIQQEGVTDSRYSFSHLHTRSPNQLALNPQPYTTVVLSGADDDDAVYPMGDYSGSYYTVIGLSLVKQATSSNEADDGSTIGVLAGAPTERGTVYGNKFYIPLGASGIAVLNGSSLSTDTTVKAVSLVVWDNKLMALDQNGELRKWDGTSWDSGTPPKLPSNQTPRKLVWFYDRNGEATVFIATDSNIWSWNAESDTITPSRVGIRIPRHPDNGLACTEWRDDALYYAMGLGVIRYSSAGAVTFIGLDRDDGLPINYHGRIVDLVPEQNGLIALVEGVQIDPPTPADEFTTDQFLNEDTTFPDNLPKALNLIMMWNEAGWHTLWHGEEPAVMKWLALSQVATPDVGSPVPLDYGVHFGVTDGDGPRDGIIPLPKYFFGPKKLVQQDSFPFAERGSHWEGRFDMGMRGFQKLASHLDMALADPENGQPFEGSVSILYRTDRNPGWRLLGTATSYGLTTFAFGAGADGFSRGEPFGWIELRYDMERGSTVTRTPVLDSVVFKFIKLPLAGTSWTVTVPLQWTGEWAGQTASSLRDFLRELTIREAFVPMQLTTNGPTYRVRVAQSQGTQPIGADPRGEMALSILRVPIAGLGEG